MAHLQITACNKLFVILKIEGYKLRLRNPNSLCDFIHFHLKFSAVGWSDIFLAITGPTCEQQTKNRKLLAQNLSWNDFTMSHAYTNCTSKVYLPALSVEQIRAFSCWSSDSALCFCSLLILRPQQCWEVPRWQLL